jgi:GAF domain-containing protein
MGKPKAPVQVSDELRRALNEVLESAVAIAGANMGNIQLLDAETGDLRIVVHLGFPDWWINYWDGVTIGRGACGTALEKGKRVIVADVETNPIFVGKDSLEIQLRAGVRAVQSTPIMSTSGKPLGMFSTHYRKPGQPDAHALNLLDLLAR